MCVSGPGGYLAPRHPTRLANGVVHSAQEAEATEAAAVSGWPRPVGRPLPSRAR